MVQQMLYGLCFGIQKFLTPTGQVESWHSEEALGELVNRIGQRGRVKERLIQTSFSCLIEQFCNEGEVRDPDMEKV